MRVEKIGNATLYLADCRKVLPKVEYDVVITDPVWPNTPEGMFKIKESPYRLMKTTANLFKAKRLVVVMRFDSDVRFLDAIPERYKYIRALNLPYNFPSHVGRTLGGMEHAYCFGEYPEAKGHKRIIPAIGPSVPYTKRELVDHPCPRPQKHFYWLVGNWAREDEVVCDPFMGSGTTGVAAVKFGRKFVGMEIDKEHFEEACKNIEQAQRQLNLFGSAE